MQMMGHFPSLGGGDGDSSHTHTSVPVDQTVNSVPWAGVAAKSNAAGSVPCGRGSERTLTAPGSSSSVWVRGVKAPVVASTTEGTTANGKKTFKKFSKADSLLTNNSSSRSYR